MPTHATLANLGRITSLTELDLSSTRCEQDEDFDNLLGSLDQLTALRTLNLSCTCVHSKGLASIGKLEVNCTVSFLSHVKRISHQTAAVFGCKIDKCLVRCLLYSQNLDCYDRIQPGIAAH